MRPLLFIAAGSVLLLASAGSAGGSGESLNRPLHLAHVAPGAPCPVSGSARAVFAGHWSSQWLIGKGPAYLLTVAGAPAGSVDVSQSLVDAKGWRGEKAPWSVRGYWGPLLIRGARLDAPGEVRFAWGTGQHLRSLYAQRGSGRQPNGARFLPNLLLVREPGCYGLQADGSTFSTTVTIRVRG